MESILNKVNWYLQLLFILEILIGHNCVQRWLNWVGKSMVWLGWIPFVGNILCSLLSGVFFNIVLQAVSVVLVICQIYLVMPIRPSLAIYHANDYPCHLRWVEIINLL